MCTVQFVVGLPSAVGLSCSGEMKVSLFLFIATIIVTIIAIAIATIVIVISAIVAIIVIVTVVTRRGGLLGVRNL